MLGFWSSSRKLAIFWLDETRKPAPIAIGEPELNEDFWGEACPAEH